MNSRRLLWLPAAVIPAAIITTALTVPALADSPALPERSAAEVLELIAGSSDTAFSGTVEQDSDLGLPELPSMGPGGGGGADDSTGGTGSSSDETTDGISSALELLTGSHEARVFVGGADTSRIQVVDTLSERNVVRNGSSVWFYDSAKNTAVHTTLPEVDPASLPALPENADTPAEFAQQLLDAVDPSTTVTVGDTARVAGRAVYTLTLTPDSDSTLVGSAALSVDAETGLPLAASITSRDDTSDSPAFSVEFTDISFDTPDANLFDFTPPAGATVVEKTVPDRTVDDTGHGQGEAPAPGEDATGEPGSSTISGSGWDTIVSIPVDEAVSAGLADAPAILDQLTTPVAEGRLFETTLVSVLLTNDGRVLVGAVPGEALQAAASGAQ